jgi:DNA-binding NarL/FixJ family response regulator
MKLLIVDDHAVVREGLAALLAQSGPDTEILQAGGSAEGFRIAAAHADLDAIVLDLTMPGMGGLEAIAEFGRRWPALPVIVLSSSDDSADVRAALAAGALGYVPKSANPGTLLAALRLVLAGEIYVPPLLLAAAPSRAPAAPPLTQRHLDVLRLLAQGLANKRIGSALGISEKTVKAHVTAIFRVLKVANRTQAAAAARRARLV